MQSQTGLDGTQQGTLAGVAISLLVAISAAVARHLKAHGELVEQLKQTRLELLAAERRGDRMKAIAREQRQAKIEAKKKLRNYLQEQCGENSTR